jgi:hypothetical protein
MKLSRRGICAWTSRLKCLVSVRSCVWNDAGISVSQIGFCAVQIANFLYLEMRLSPKWNARIPMMVRNRLEARWDLQVALFMRVWPLMSSCFYLSCVL